MPKYRFEGKVYMLPEGTSQEEAFDFLGSIEPSQSSPEPAQASLAPNPSTTITPEKKEYIRQHEGVRNQVYRDTKGIATIGVGLNLEAEHTGDMFKEMGFDDSQIEAVKEGKIVLQQTQIDELFDKSLNLAEKDVKDLVPDFDTHPPQIRKALLDMSFNLGKTSMSGFKNMLRAVEERDYEKAAKEMRDSKYYREDVPVRAEGNARLLESI